MFLVEARPTVPTLRRLRRPLTYTSCQHLDNQVTHRFAHHLNPDGTVDTVCILCSQTIASATDEANLVFAEERHVCDPFLLAHYEFFKKEPRSETVFKLVSRDQKRGL